MLKNTYDFTKKQELESIQSNALPELIIENFDLEQIWQQVELQNDEVLDKSVTNVSRLAVAKNRLLFEDVNKDEDTDESDDVNDEDEVDDEKPEQNESDEDENNVSDKEDIEDEEEAENRSNKPFKSSVVDDEFFKLNEMNNFLLSEEKKLNKTTKKVDSDSESEGSVDMFEAGSEQEDDDIEGNDKLKNPRYKDFFGTKTQQRMERENRKMMLSGNEHSEVEAYSEDDEKESDDVDNDENEEDQDDEDDESKQKSSLELREERLKMKIKEIEEAAVSEKPWQLKGEVTAESRPENSLLQEVLEFDLSTRPGTDCLLSLSI